MKKILFLLLLVLGVVTISACNGQMTYECEPKEEWSYDETKHWHDCVIPTCKDHIDEEEHSFGEWSLAEEGDAENPGTKKRECEICDYVEEVAIDDGEHFHSYSEDYKYNSDKHWYECSCEDKIEEADHDWNIIVITPATDTKDGKAGYTCKVCGYAETRTIPATTHTHSPASNWSSNDEHHWHACDGCVQLFDKAEHTWNTGEVLKPATETETGIMKYTCQVCGHEKQSPIPMLAHTHKPASSWSSDADNHWHSCSGCSELLDKVGHTWNAGEVLKPATETETGIMKYTCEVCGYEKEVDIPVLSHVHSYTVLKGDETGHWNECSCTLARDEVVAHEYGEWTNKTETQENTCSVCNYVGSRPITDVWDLSSVSTSLTGEGTEANPYQIHSGADLAFFKDNVASFAGKYVKLMRNIDLNNASFMIASFAGTFDGNNYSILGLNITGEATGWPGDGVGLFKVLVAAGTIKNLTVKGSVQGWTKTGGIVGFLEGTITNCVNYANVESKWASGGIAGESIGTITNCKNYGNLTNGHSSNGGIVGKATGGSVSNSHNYGMVSAPGSSEGEAWGVGGVVGETSVPVTDCSNEGIINGIGQVGGIVGKTTSTITNCTNKGSVTATKDRAGGIAGLSTASIDNCNNVSSGTVTGNGWGAGGIAGEAMIVKDCVNEGNVTSAGQVGGIVGYVLASGSISGSTNTGKIVANIEQVGGIAGYSKSSITNCSNSGTVEACGSDGKIAAANRWAGGIVGNFNGTEIVSCTNSGTIAGNNNIGGIVGAVPWVENKTVSYITSCENTGTVNATAWGNGGIVGTIDTTYIKECINRGNVNTGDVTGGIVGCVYGNSTLEKCDNYGTISGWTTLAGIASSNEGTIINCDNYGELKVNPDNANGTSAPIVIQNKYNGTYDADCEDKRSAN